MAPGSAGLSSGDVRQLYPYHVSHLRRFQISFSALRRAEARRYYNDRGYATFTLRPFDEPLLMKCSIRADPPYTGLKPGAIVMIVAAPLASSGDHIRAGVSQGPQDRHLQ